MIRFGLRGFGVLIFHGLGRRLHTISISLCWPCKNLIEWTISIETFFVENWNKTKHFIVKPLMMLRHKESYFTSLILLERAPSYISSHLYVNKSMLCLCYIVLRGGTQHKGTHMTHVSTLIMKLRHSSHVTYKVIAFFCFLYCLGSLMFRTSYYNVDIS